MGAWEAVHRPEDGIIWLDQTSTKRQSPVISKRKRKKLQRRPPMISLLNGYNVWPGAAAHAVLICPRRSRSPPSRLGSGRLTASFIYLLPVGKRSRRHGWTPELQVAAKRQLSAPRRSTAVQDSHSPSRQHTEALPCHRDTSTSTISSICYTHECTATVPVASQSVFFVN